MERWLRLARLSMWMWMRLSDVFEALLKINKDLATESELCVCVCV